MARIMKWDGFNLLAPQNMTKNLVGYGDLKPTDVTGNMILKDNSAGVPNRFFGSLTDQQKDARVLWDDLNTRGAGNQLSTGAFQVRFWYYASSGFKTIPSGLHYSWARSYNSAGEWIHCLNYRGRDLVMRTGEQYGNKEIVVWKNALSDSGWANKWHRIELSCNNTKQGSAVRIDSRSWKTSYWSKTNNPILAGFSLGAIENSSPSNVAFRNLEIIDNHDADNFTYDWVPPVGPAFTLPASKTVAQNSEVANISPVTSSVGNAPLREARWYRTWKPTGATFVSRTPVKTENVETTAFEDFNYVGGPYTEEGTDAIELVVTDQNNIKTAKIINVYVGASPDTGPDISAPDKTIIAGTATSVNVTVTSAGSNGAEFEMVPIKPIEVDPHSETGYTEPELEEQDENTLPWWQIPVQSGSMQQGDAQGATGLQVLSTGVPYTIIPSESNPEDVGFTTTYNRTGSYPRTLLAITFRPFSAPGNYSYQVNVENSNGIATGLIFEITVEAVDVPEWTFNSPAPPNEDGTVPAYFIGTEFPVDIEVDTGNGGKPTYVADNSTMLGTALTNTSLAAYNGHYRFTAVGTVTESVDVNGLSIGIIDSLGNVSESPVVYYNARVPVAPTIELTPDFLVNANVTTEFTIMVNVIDGTFPLNPATYRWDILSAPTGYDGLLTYTTYSLKFANYDTQGNYTFEYVIEDTEGVEYKARCNVYISFGSVIDDDKPRDILDWMSNTQLEQEATKALSGIVLRGNNKQDIEWYRRQVLSLQIPNIGTMSYEEVERQYYKAIINGDIYRENGLYGTIDGGTPDDIIVDDAPELPDDTDSDDPTEPPIVPDPTHPPVTPPTPAEITYDLVVQLEHNPRRVIQSFAWDQPRNVWYGAQVNPDSTSDTLIYKFDSTGAYIGTMNMLDAGHGSSIAYQRSGTTDYIWTYHSAIGIDENKSIVRAKYTNGSSVTINSSDVQRTPTFYPQYSPVNIYNEYITIVTRVSGKDTFRQYKLDDYLAGNNKPVRVRTVSINTSMGAYQGHTADEKYIYVARGGSSYDSSKPSTLWDKSHVMIYRWSDGKAWDINTTAVGMDVASGRSESEGIQRYDVGGVKNIYIGKATGKTGARIHRVYKFTRDEMEAWFNG